MKKRLLFVHPALHFGGAEKSLQTLLCSIDYARYDVDLLLFRREGELLGLLPPQVRILDLPPTAQTFSLPLAEACASFLRQGKPSLAAARTLFSRAVRGDLPIRTLEQRGWKYQKQAYSPLPQVYDAAIAYLEGSPVWYCAEFVQAKKKLAVLHSDYRKLEMNRDFDSAYFARFDHVAGVSDACADVLRSVFPEHREKICVLENIVSPSALRALSVQDAGFDDGYAGLRVLTMGRLDEPKGIDLALEACRMLADTLDFRWYVLGDGQQRPLLEERVARYGLADRFLLLGAKLNPYPYLAQCDVYVQPSRFEGKSIALEEAKCFAKPILTTAFTTVRAQITDGDNGVVAQIEPADIAEKLRSLLTDTALRARLCGRLRDYSGNPGEIEKFYALID